jgi:hypothetical protein
MDGEYGPCSAQPGGGGAAAAAEAPNAASAIKGAAVRMSRPVMTASIRRDATARHPAIG